MTRLIIAVLLVGYTASGRAEKPKKQAPVQVQFRRAETKAGPGLIAAVVVGTKRKVYLHKKADATNADIRSVRATVDGRCRPAVEVVFTKAGAKKIAKLTKEHQDRPLAILVDGKVVSAPIVIGEIGERALITGVFTTEDVVKLVNDITGE